MTEKDIADNRCWIRFGVAARHWRTGLIFLALLLICFILIVPLAAVFFYALEKGWETYLAALTDSETRSSIWLTVWTAGIAVPLNLLFGLAAAWSIAKFQFPGRSLLVTLIDLPLSVSPVIAGMIFVLLFGAQGLFAPLLSKIGIKIIFAMPGIIIATTFITVPFIARELIPVMQELGNSDEEAALTMGASGWRVFFTITLPNVKWGVIYGLILCNARAMGEFGAVSVVSGHIRGWTNTMPLQIEVLYNEYNFSAAFAVASLLALLAIATLALKMLVEWYSLRNRGSQLRRNGLL